MLCFKTLLCVRILVKLFYLIHIIMFQYIRINARIEKIKSSI